MMTKKLLACLLLATSMITGIYADQSLEQDVRSGLHEMKNKCGSWDCKTGKTGKAGKDGRPGRAGKNGKDGKDGICCCKEDKRGIQTAFFFLRPSDLDGDIFIPDESPIYWEYDLFTVKSSGINVGGASSPDINISEKGIYLITWTVFARSAGEGEGEVDWISAELRLDGTPIRGSRFTAVNISGDATELVGQVITYIPKNTNINLVNVTGYGFGLYTENEGGRNGDVASIAITKIGDSVE